jgi:hypothetical protein
VAFLISGGYMGVTVHDILKMERTSLLEMNLVEKRNSLVEITGKGGEELSK